MAVMYYVVLPFVRTEEDVAPGEAQEMPNKGAAIRRAESMSREPTLARSRSSGAAIRTWEILTTPRF